MSFSHDRLPFWLRFCNGGNGGAESWSEGFEAKRTSIASWEESAVLTSDQTMRRKAEGGSGSAMMQCRSAQELQEEICPGRGTSGRAGCEVLSYSQSFAMSV